MAERLATRKHHHIEATQAQAVFTGNAGCLLQIGRKIRQANLPVWVAHPIEAVGFELPPKRRASANMNRARSTKDRKME